LDFLDSNFTASLFSKFLSRANRYLQRWEYKGNLSSDDNPGMQELGVPKKAILVMQKCTEEELESSLEQERAHLVFAAD
jgi:hypothetical protein